MFVVRGKSDAIFAVIAEITPLPYNTRLLLEEFQGWGGPSFLKSPLPLPNNSDCPIVFLSMRNCPIISTSLSYVRHQKLTRIHTLFLNES